MSLVRDKSLAVIISLLLALFGEAAFGQPADDTRMTIDGMRELRERGWRLLVPFARRTEGLPDPSEWQPRFGLMPLSEKSGISSSRVALQRAFEQETAPSEPGELPLYELTFFNTVAANFIKESGLNVPDTVARLRRELRREIEFPRGSVAVKTFWYVVKPGEVINVRVWDWNAIGNRTRLPEDLLPTRCVAQEPRQGCLVAQDAFYTLRVQDPSDFTCDDCPPLEAGDLLILVALHIASKEMPEWLWATFWWRDADAPSGTFWTCGDAQREAVLGEVGLPWSNYSMDVTASFTMAKPRPRNQAEAACGFPGEIGEGEQLRAAYNPFVEAFFENGLKSSCVDCHSRATTNREDIRNDVPEVNEPAGPALRDLEGHVRLDYMWSLWNVLRSTEFPLADWPKGADGS